MAPKATGSSPLTRGKPGHDAPAADCGRLIPAHAGKTRRTQGAGGRVGAHPRSRGENSHAATMTDESKGSSPLTRGKLRVLKLPLPARGLIPAHAGKTSGVTAVVAASVGSSPLTRGKPLRVRPPRKHQGLIPAHAGKTARRAVRPVLVRAHPRSRGENVSRERPSGRSRGSSPLTRGKRAARSSSRSRRGLIPAHAGKTCASICMGVGIRAHPRSRGENRRGRLRGCR